MAGPRCILRSGPRACGRVWEPCWLDGPDGEGVDAIKSTPNQSGELLRVELNKQDKITRTNFGPKQKILVSTQVGHIFLLDLNANRYRRVGSFGRIQCTALDMKEGLKALVGLEEGQVNCKVLVLDTVTGAIKGRLYHPGHLHWVAFSEGAKLAVGMGQREATVWNLQQSQSVYRLKICDDGSELGCVGLLGGVGEFKLRIVSSNIEGQVTVWGASRTSSPLQVINQFGEHCQCVAAQIYQETIFIGRSTGDVAQYSLESGEVLSLTPTPPHLAVTGLRGLASVLVVEHAGGLVFVEVGRGTLLAQMEGAGQASLSPCGRLMARVTMREGVMLLYKLQTILPKLNSKNNPHNLQADLASKESAMECSNYKPCPQNPTAPPPTNVLKVQNSNTPKNKKCGNKISNAETELILNNVTKENLLPMLKSIGCGFPSRHREVIWCQILRLPRNKKAFARLVELGPHPAIPTTPDQSSVILSALFHWSPCLSLLPYIQLFLSPFANLFSRHPRAGFEVCLSILHNYCQDWWMLVPKPPPSAREAWQLLDKEDSCLAAHLHSLGCDSRTCIWPILQTGWSLVLPSSSWCTQLREGLLRCTSSLQVSTLLSSQQDLQVSQLLRTAYKIQENHPSCSSEYKELHKTSYPKPIQLLNEKEIIAGELAAGTKIYVPTSDQKYQSKKIRNALNISPPPLPRIAHNVKKAEAKDRSEGHAQKAVLGQAKLQSEICSPHFDFKSSLPPVVGEESTRNPMEPLLPLYTRPTDTMDPLLPRCTRPTDTMDPLLPQCTRPTDIQNQTNDGAEDIVALLDKAKFIRNLLSTK